MQRIHVTIALAGLLATLAATSGCTSGPTPTPTASAVRHTSAAQAKHQSPVPRKPQAGAAQQPLYLAAGEHGVTIGVKSDQPQTSVMSGSSFSGFEIFLANYIMSHTAGTQPAFVPVVTADRGQKLLNRQVDMIIATYSDTPQREKLVEMAGPYMRTDEGILVLRSRPGISAFSDLKKKTVCTTVGSTTLAPGSPLTVPGAVGSIVKKSDISECITLLRTRNVQAVASDLLILYGYQETSSDLTVVPGIDIAEPNEWMVGLQPGDKNDCSTVLRALRSFLQSQWAAEFQDWFPDVVHTDPTWAIDYSPDPQGEPLRCT